MKTCSTILLVISLLFLGLVIPSWAYPPGSFGVTFDLTSAWVDSSGAGCIGTLTNGSGPLYSVSSYLVTKVRLYCDPDGRSPLMYQAWDTSKSSGFGLSPGETRAFSTWVPNAESVDVGPGREVYWELCIIGRQSSDPNYQYQTSIFVNDMTSLPAPEPAGLAVVLSGIIGLVGIIGRRRSRG